MSIPNYAGTPMVIWSPQRDDGRVRKQTSRRLDRTLMALLVGSLLGMTGCVVNPVPTPGDKAAVSNDTGFQFDNDAMTAADTGASHTDTGGAGTSDANSAEDTGRASDAGATDASAVDSGEDDGVGDAADLPDAATADGMTADGGLVTSDGE
ncbi:MAG: hypothetical protein KC502_08075 [Myxococcales bacterium]|nr:hypothetical protein [Myxococcales bacterium]